jgi:hypothetical protein
MPIFVSCIHCKRPVLVVPRMSDREVVWLYEHLAACESDDPSLEAGVGSVLSHFRTVRFEAERQTERAVARSGARYAR